MRPQPPREYEKACTHIMRLVVEHAAVLKQVVRGQGKETSLTLLCRGVWPRSALPACLGSGYLKFLLVPKEGALGILTSLSKCEEEREAGRGLGLKVVSIQTSEVEPNCIIGKDIFLQGPSKQQFDSRGVIK